MTDGGDFLKFLANVSGKERHRDPSLWARAVSSFPNDPPQLSPLPIKWYRPGYEQASRDGGFDPSQLTDFTMASLPGTEPVVRVPKVSLQSIRYIGSTER